MTASRTRFKLVTPYFTTRPAFAALLEKLLLPLDRLFNRLYGSRYNPLLQSGSLAVLFLATLIVTGLYLLIFYKIHAPYDSVAGLEAQWWAGKWIRGVHSYAGDAMMIAVGFHALRMMVKGKTWGPRALAWITGVMAVSIMVVSGWTGLVLVWDIQGELVAVEGAKLLDYLPIFSEPIQRTFTDPAGMDSGFFFLNLILHMVIPFCLVVMLCLHTQRVARPVLLPPRALGVGVVVALLGLSVAWPLDMLPRADPGAMLGRVPIDWFYGLWLLVARNAPPPVTFAVVIAVGLVLVSVPWWWRPSRKEPAQPAIVNEQLCTGCSQCYTDCPYEAISMVPSPQGKTDTEVVARVNPKLCVSCGICAGSCGPMVTGPPGRTGRDHLMDARRFINQAGPGDAEVVVMACAQGLGADILPKNQQGAYYPYSVHCVGGMHTSAIEYLLRRGIAGVYLLACPGRDCLYREGPKWMHERLYNDREAELQPRVDKNRVRLGTFGRDEAAAALADIRAFREQVAAIQGIIVEDDDLDLDPTCEVMEKAHG